MFGVVWSGGGWQLMLAGFGGSGEAWEAGASRGRLAADARADVVDGTGEEMVRNGATLADADAEE